MLENRRYAARSGAANASGFAEGKLAAAALTTPIPRPRPTATLVALSSTERAAVEKAAHDDTAKQRTQSMCHAVRYHPPYNHNPRGKAQILTTAGTGSNTGSSSGEHDLVEWCTSGAWATKVMGQVSCDHGTKAFFPFPWPTQAYDARSL